jgi:cytochrome c553
LLVPACRRKEIKKAKTRVMPSSHLNDPEHWRDRAKEARAMAEDMADPVSKQKMLDVAANYETRRRPQGLEKPRNLRGRG